MSAAVAGTRISQAEGTSNVKQTLLRGTLELMSEPVADGLLALKAQLASLAVEPSRQARMVSHQ
jgi:hypothetical protein